MSLALLASLASLAASVAATRVPAVIGTSVSQAALTLTETEMFSHTVSEEGEWAYMNHFWAAGSPAVDRAIFRYYVDGEVNASVVFSPALACGVGWGDQTAPWGNRWMGKAANSTGWFHNIPVPFYKSIRITYQMALEDAGVAKAPGAGPRGGAVEQVGSRVWAIVRGSEGLPLHLGELEVPLRAGGVRLELQRRSAQLAPLDFYSVASAPAGQSGTVFLTSLFVRGTGSVKFMEGCWRMRSPPAQAWPGTLLASGMEDYYDSAFYFDGGGFHLPDTGATHLPGPTGSRDFTFSGYRFHEVDPLVFRDGIDVQWRNGDVTDPATGLKCTLQSGGVVAGPPDLVLGPSAVSSYAWVYTWPPGGAFLRRPSTVDPFLRARRGS
ncbi:unnamed protein product [Prorocentrum cordatum]|uniref:Beta-galactosidase n=1 Tax=Prorocentrum cordatum TaxID=2364126 RepID=A0ABN9RVW7_9DINO|nr:unnamed protein product [Polarella glacialis]